LERQLVPLSFESARQRLEQRKPAAEVCYRFRIGRALERLPAGPL
jgi:hypothetical protein